MATFTSFGWFPFCISEKNEILGPYQQWDGSTLFNGIPSGSSDQQVTVYGEGTYYPLKLNLNQLMQLIWMVNYITINYGSVSFSSNASASGGGASASSMISEVGIDIYKGGFGAFTGYHDTNYRFITSPKMRLCNSNITNCDSNYKQWADEGMDFSNGLNHEQYLPNGVYSRYALNPNSFERIENSNQQERPDDLEDSGQLVKASCSGYFSINFNPSVDVIKVKNNNTDEYWIGSMLTNCAASSFSQGFVTGGADSLDINNYAFNAAAVIGIYTSPVPPSDGPHDHTEITTGTLEITYVFLDGSTIFQSIPSALTYYHAHRVFIPGASSSASASLTPPSSITITFHHETP